MKIYAQIWFRKSTRSIVAIPLVLATICSCATTRPQPLTQIPDRIVVKKSARTLSVLLSDRTLKTYPISLGIDPVGPKRQRGDCKTPEGRYHITRKGVSGNFHRFLHLSYPSVQDIKEARKRGVDPGDDIQIHGFPAEFAGKEDRMIKADWTHGCIALRNNDIAELELVIQPGTPVEILP